MEKSDERGQSRTAQVFDAVTGKPFITLYTNFKTMNTFLNCGRSNKNRSLKFLRLYFCHNEIIYNRDYIVSEIQNKLCRD